jgi:hypothetical protein
MEEICIEVIDRLEDFQQLKQNWDSVYDADSEAQFSLSWLWQAADLRWTSKFGKPWLILAAKLSPADSDYVAFFPLGFLLGKHPEGYLYSELEVIGAVDSAHLGFICRPEYQLGLFLPSICCPKRGGWMHFSMNLWKQDLDSKKRVRLIH